MSLEVPVVGSIVLSTVSRCTFGEFLGFIAIIGIGAQFGALPQFGQHGLQLIFRNREEHGNGLQLRNDGEAIQRRWSG